MFHIVSPMPSTPQIQKEASSEKSVEETKDCREDEDYSLWEHYDESELEWMAPTERRSDFDAPGNAELDMYLDFLV